MRLRFDSVGAFEWTVRIADLDTPPAPAVITDELVPAVVSAVIVKAALVAPPVTVTLSGTDAAVALPLESVTTRPPAGAGAVNVTVPVLVAPSRTDVGLTVRLDGVGAAVEPVVTLRTDDLETPPLAAVIVIELVGGHRAARDGELGAGAPARHDDARRYPGDRGVAARQRHGLPARGRCGRQRDRPGGRRASGDGGGAQAEAGEGRGRRGGGDGAARQARIRRSRRPVVDVDRAVGGPRVRVALDPKLPDPSLVPTATPSTEIVRPATALPPLAAWLRSPRRARR